MAKTICAYSVIVSLMLTCFVSISFAGEVVDWKGIEQAYSEYIEYPSDENARKVRDLLPAAGHVEYTGEQLERAAIEFIYSNIRMLERQIISRDRDAVKLGFRLITIADGGFREDLYIMLGQLIRIDPEMFLRELKEAEELVGRLEWLVRIYGDIYVDRFDAKRLETERRKRALKSVSDPALKDIRDRCINALENY